MRPVLIAFVKILAALAALVALLSIASCVGLAFLFRTREAPPVTEAVAAAGLVDVWLGPGKSKAADLRLLHHRKEVIWDGTSHEEWVAFVPGPLDLDQQTSPFLKMDNARDLWPLPDAALAAGHHPPPSFVYQAAGRGGGTATENPSMTEALIWPAPPGWIVRYRHTVVD